jgi:hypothetical protein
MNLLLIYAHHYPINCQLYEPYSTHAIPRLMIVSMYCQVIPWYMTIFLFLRKLSRVHSEITTHARRNTSKGECTTIPQASTKNTLKRENRKQSSELHTRPPKCLLKKEGPLISGMSAGEHQGTPSGSQIRCFANPTTSEKKHWMCLPPTSNPPWVAI